MLAPSAYAIRLDKMTSRKRLNMHQAAFANKQYKSHQKVGTPNKIIQSLASQDQKKYL